MVKPELFVASLKACADEFKYKVLFEKNYTTVELNIFVTIQLRANLKVPAERP